MQRKTSRRKATAEGEGGFSYAPKEQSPGLVGSGSSIRLLFIHYPRLLRDGAIV